ncbi:MAG: TIGR04211 family SH3 domain-containing protein [Gammaproteobacteria bacterium]
MNTRITQFLSLILMALSIISTSWAESRQYVTDDLTIPMRTGITTGHKILKFLNSGTPVLIKKISEDGNYTQIMLEANNNKLGWVETKYLQDQPVARDRIISIDKNIASIRDKNKALKKDLSNLNQQHQDLNKENTQLESKIQNLLDTLSKLRESAAKPIEIAEENIQLKKDITEQKQVNEKLSNKISVLSDKNIKEWFLIGGGVSIGSLILGLLLTRISWKKKNQWGSGY